ncbi:hypothetical protein SAMN06265349_1011114 [Flavobacterium resistens]|uniref:Uncharacterized protein n=1 Tax=Flavobacterium resistens TaxID=443612 RepID=A0A521BK99_9FLAO|nr:hypothetical protein SAMN06265349_1011114 [Flavobacterium resistens]
MLSVKGNEHKTHFTSHKSHFTNYEFTFLYS